MFWKHVHVYILESLVFSSSRSPCQRLSVPEIEECSRLISWEGLSVASFGERKTKNAERELCVQGYREDNGLHLESDADEQLLLFIPFNQVVKLHSLIIRGTPEEGKLEIQTFCAHEAFLQGSSRAD